MRLNLYTVPTITTSGAMAKIGKGWRLQEAPAGQSYWDNGFIYDHCLVNARDYVMRRVSSGTAECIRAALGSSE